uniref:CCHC-type domain-containing protein n=1 Tax=Glossina austeni TaxID=7395 RepID=A0A1A9VM76_GLOAU
MVEKLKAKNCKDCTMETHSAGEEIEEINQQFPNIEILPLSTCLHLSASVRDSAVHSPTCSRERKTKACKNKVDGSQCCLNCGKPGQKAKECKNQRECAVSGRKELHKRHPMGSRSCLSCRMAVTQTTT